MSLAEKLVTLRKQKGLTQTDLAEKLNVSRQAISRWEVGAAVPNTENLRILSDIYEISVDRLMNDDVESVTKDVDIQTTENSTYKGKSNVQNHWITCIAVSLVLILLTIIISVATTSDHEPERPTSMETMYIEDDDDHLPTVTFSIE